MKIEFENKPDTRPDPLPLANEARADDGLFTFLPWEEDEDTAIRAVEHAERRKRESAYDVGDRVAVVCACLAGLYMLMRGVWWGLLWLIGQ